MPFLINCAKMTETQIRKIAKESANYFLNCFQQDQLDVISIINMLLQSCMKDNELAIHLGLLHYCRLYKHDLPQHYIDVVADNDSYNFYCRELTLNLVRIVLSN